MSWQAGDALVDQAYEWLARKHVAMGSPMFALDERSHELDVVVEAAYATQDRRELKKALNTYCAHVRDAMRAGMHKPNGCKHPSVTYRGGTLTCMACGMQKQPREPWPEPATRGEVTA